MDAFSFVVHRHARNPPKGTSEQNKSAKEMDGDEWIAYEVRNTAAVLGGEE
jgi:hypothetical protein